MGFHPFPRCCLDGLASDRLGGFPLNPGLPSRPGPPFAFVCTQVNEILVLRTNGQQLFSSAITIRLLV